jgi:tetratricopeptide (TPR) repeat protein
MCRDSLILLVTLALSTVSIADPHELYLLFAKDPATDEYKSGDLNAAIELLESRDKMADSQRNIGDELATLCAFYILKGNLDSARERCSAAVEIDQSDLAYNNRGVLRAQQGNTVGALEDFDHVRVLPEDQPRYIEQLKEADVRFTASINFARATEIMAEHRTNKPTMTRAVKGAKIEDLNQ